MRDKLNENPLLQAAVIGVLALIVGFMLLKNMSGGGGGGEEALPATAPSPTGEAAAPAPATTAPVTGAPATAPETGVEPAPATGGKGAGEEFAAGPGLPKAVAEAYDDNKVVVLLIVRGNATDDRKVAPMVAALNQRDDTAAWIVKAFHIAKYSRIANGVDVDRTPALVVVQPKKLTEGAMPEASVSYGFRGKQNVDQQVQDALYNGPEDLSYSPNEVN